MGHLSSKLLGIGVILIYACPLLRANADERKDVKWIPLPIQGQVCVAHAEYRMPYTQRGIQQRTESRKHLFRENDERGVYIRDDQVIGFCCQGSGELEYLAGVPDGQLRDFTLLAARISDDGIKQLTRCHGLTHLSLSLDCIDNIDKVIAAAPGLVQFALGTPSIPTPLNDKHFFTDERFSLFADSPHLRSVRIVSPLLSDEALRLVAKLSQLEVLEIQAETLDIRAPRKISDDGLKALVGAKQLREIVLHVGPKCTDDGVKELLKLEHLEWIEIQGMQKVEPATVEALKAKFPDAHIEFKPRVSR